MPSNFASPRIQNFAGCHHILVRQKEWNGDKNGGTSHLFDRVCFSGCVAGRKNETSPKTNNVEDSSDRDLARFTLVAHCRLMVTGDHVGEGSHFGSIDDPCHTH